MFIDLLLLQAKIVMLREDLYWISRMTRLCGKESHQEWSSGTNTSGSGNHFLWGISLSISACQLIFLECDSQVVINALVSTKYNGSKFGHIVDDIRVMLNSFSQWNCGHMGRDANRVAHYLAKEATKYAMDRTWWIEILSCITDIVRFRQFAQS